MKQLLTYLIISILSIATTLYAAPKTGLISFNTPFQASPKLAKATVEELIGYEQILEDAVNAKELVTGIYESCDLEITMTCNNTRTAPTCGNGIVDQDREECDEFSATCNACKIITKAIETNNQVCGNGIREGQEECDATELSYSPADPQRYCSVLCTIVNGGELAPTGPSKGMRTSPPSPMQFLKHKSLKKNLVPKKNIKSAGHI